MAMKVNAGQLLELLSHKHNDDIFVPECKDGPTWYGKHFRLDAWAMNRSWASLKFTGYEIKISRSDYLNDTKKHEYLDYCNEAYLVCPREVLTNDEIPVDWGLMIPSKNVKKLYVVKKAPFRQIDPPSSLLLYILMCRSSIRQNHREYDKKSFWECMLKSKDNDRILGQAVSQKIKRAMREQIERVESENNRLKNEYGRYDEIKKLLSEMGINNIDDYWKIRNFICDITPDKLITNLKSTADKINDTISRLESSVTK